VTLTKHRGLSKPEDEQLHVLPLYVMDLEDEHGNRDAQIDKIETGALEVLQIYPMEARIRSSPLTPKRKKGKKDKESPGPKKRGPKKGSTRANSVSPQEKAKDISLVNHSQDSNQSDNMYFQSGQQSKNTGADLNMCKNTGQLPHGNAQAKNQSQVLGKDIRKMIAGKTFLTYEDMMMLSSEPGFSNLYESFWNHFYSCGTFPPPSFLNSWYGDKGESGTAQNISGHFNNSGQNDTHPGLMKGNNSSSQPPDPSVISQSSTSISQNTHCQGAVNNQGSQGDPNLPSSLSQRQQSTPNQGMDFSNPVLQNEVEAAFHNGHFIKQEQGTNGMAIGRTRPSSTLSDSGMSRPFESPLHLLSEAVTMRTKELENNGQFGSLPSNLPQNIRGDNSNHLPFQGSYNQSLPYNNNQHQHSNKLATDFVSPNMSASHHDPFNDFAIPFPSSQESRKSDSVIDPTVVKCEMEYNENAFTDPNIGGVAIALSHGAVLFEVAKRELHATTGLRNPNRYSPTRISLVFYQHKNMNHANHGWHEYERKLERLRQQRMEKLKEESTGIKLDLPEIPVQNGAKKTKKTKKEKVDIMETSAAQYKYMWDAPTSRATSLTTDSVITRWIDPQPMVTGPYQRWV